MDSVLENCSKSSVVRKNPCLKSMIDKLYEQRYETGDIKFIIDSEEILAHRCVLAALSPKYKAQFYGPMSQKDVVNVADVSAAAFKEFLLFFYMDEVTLTLENIEDVLNLAKQSLVDELVAECTKFLLDFVGMDKLIWFYQLAIQYQIEPLEAICVKQIGANIKSVFKTSDFLDCDQATLCYILALDSLSCNEIDVFDACISWAQAKCKQNGLDAANTSNLRVALGDAIFKIRFCSMTAEQFATIGKTYSGLLSSHESNEVYCAIALKASGEVSRIFGANNSKPRKSIPSILECSFSTGSLKWAGDYIGLSDYIHIRCDRSINLHGFIISHKIDGIIDVKVTISDIPKEIGHAKSILDNETKIIFHKPIFLEANKDCRIAFSSHALVVHCNFFEYLERVQQDGVSFQFENGRSMSSITRLLYNNVE